eukprot:gene25972-biopygen12473
MNLDDNEQARA